MFQTVNHHDLSNIPAVPGVYMFHASPIRLSTMGLKGVGPWDDEYLREVRTQLVQQVVLQMEFLASMQSYIGKLWDPVKFPAHRTTIKLKGDLSYSEYLTRKIEELPLRGIPAFVETLDATSTSLPPIYVGISERSTLQDRFRQHKAAYEGKADDDIFGVRLRNTYLGWSDLVYSYTPIQQVVAQESIIRILEDYLQFFSKPLLGRK